MVSAARKATLCSSLWVVGVFVAGDWVREVGKYRQERRGIWWLDRIACRDALGYQTYCAVCREILVYQW